MIIEAFEKGTNFKKHHDTFSNIESIEHDNGNYILITEYEKENIVLSSKEYKLRVL